MAKFAGTSVTPGQATALEESAAALPALELAELTPQSAPSEGGGLFDKIAAAPLEDIMGGIQAGAEAEITQQEQVDRELVPTIAARAATPLEETAEWTPQKLLTSTAQPRTDGGLKTRASNMATLFGGADPSTKLSLTPSTVESREAAAVGNVNEVARLESEQQQGSLIAALNRSGAVNSTQDPVSRKWVNEVDPVMLQVGSAVTENMLSEASFGDTDSAIQDIDPNQSSPTVSKADSNSALGKQIHRDYMRMKNNSEGKPTDDYTDLSREEATTLGDAFKEMWAIANPTLINRGESGGQVVFQLTPEGVDAMKKGAYDRKKLFPKKNIKPAKSPPRGGQLPGEQGRTLVKRQTGKVNKPLVGAEVLKESTRNLASVPNVVDKQRERILYATILPVLSGQLDWKSPEAEINNIGESKMRGFQAAEAAYNRRVKEGAAQGEKPYSAAEELETLQHTIAQEVRSIAQERNGANHLTYVIQSFNGRISPQQTYFDPTSSKAVRFVTRNAVPAFAAPNSRISRNLEQMYAMMLVKGADSLLPEGRLKAFGREAKKLEQWGDRLSEVLDKSISNEQADAIAQAISEGVPLTDPKFPQVPRLALDPTQDGELIKAIKSKGEDGPHFIDGLIDAANYIKARRNNRPYSSYFNAYIDGKTNGIASNGIQMGSEQVARATGVIRDNTRELLDDGDIRDQLKKSLHERLETSGFENVPQDSTPELYDIARTLYGTRDLNKGTTMTFAYGKELASFKQDIEEYLDINYEKLKDDPNSSYAQSYETLMNTMDRGKVIDTLHQFYVGSLADVLSDEAIQSRSIMRSAAMMHSLTDQLFTIQSATGFDLNLGGEATLGFDTETATSYSYSKDGRRTKVVAGQYETYSTAAAIRTQFNPDGSPVFIPGEDAYGGSVPGPIQSLDAATVALSSSGKSWNKLKAASNGNPYMHTIYDAFKLDAMGFDVMIQEINNNWLNASMDWSYLEETRDATQNALAAFNKKMASVPDSAQIPIDLKETITLPDGTPFSGRMMGWLLEPQDTQSGKQFPTRLSNKLRNLVGGDNASQVENVSKEGTQRILNAVRDAGVDINNMGNTVTKKQYMIFLKAMAKELNLGSRLGAMINTTNENKKNLRKKIKLILQYYAH